MDMTADKKLIEQLIRHEGLKLMPYRCTSGKLTIGVGRNLEDTGITKDEAMSMLLSDIYRCTRECRKSFTFFDSLTDTRQHVLVNMCFNLGIVRLRGFRRMIAALERGDYGLAAKEMLDSQWAAQVGGRSAELAGQMKEG